VAKLPGGGPPGNRRREPLVPAKYMLAIPALW